MRWNILPKLIRLDHNHKFMFNKSTNEGMVMKKITSVDDYLKSVPKGMRTALNKLRKTIKAAAPDAEEVISYQMPAFRQNGILVYYAAFKDHCSLFVGSAHVRRQFCAELKRFQAGKGTVRFTPDRPLPAGLVTRIVKARVAENTARRPSRHRT